MRQCLKLKDIFKDNSDFAWRLLEAEAAVHVKKNVNIIDITTLSELYMNAVERLNSVHDAREKFFQQKMQKFMGEPYVIRCFSNLSGGKESQLQCKRKEIEQKISIQNQKKNPDRLNQMLIQFTEKQRKMKNKIDKILDDHQKALQQRIRKRQALRKDRSFIQSLETSSNTKSKITEDGENDKIVQLLPLSQSNSRVTKCTTSEYMDINSP